MNRRQLLLGGAALALAPSLARAQIARPLKIGVLNDMSGVYADFQGPGSVIAAHLAADDYSGPLGVPGEEGQERLPPGRLGPEDVVGAARGARGDGLVGHGGLSPSCRGGSGRRRTRRPGGG